jgi:hypothetical protein
MARVLRDVSMFCKSVVSDRENVSGEQISEN